MTSTNPICYPLPRTPKWTTSATTDATITTTGITEWTTIVTTEPTTTTGITESTTIILTDEPTTSTGTTERTTIVTTEPTTSTGITERTTSTTVHYPSVPYERSHRIKCFNYFNLTSNPPENSDFKSYSNQIPLLSRIITNGSEDISIFRPIYRLDIHNINENEVNINFYHYYGESFKNRYLLIYYPEDFDASDSSMTEEQVKDEMRCSFINNHTMKIVDLDPSTSYKFCVLASDSILSPFGCQLHQTVTPVARQTWIKQEYKVITLTSFVITILFALITGIIITYLLIQIRMSGSKHSSHKDPPMSASTEASHTMTPLPTHNVDQRLNTQNYSNLTTFKIILIIISIVLHRPPLERSSSDMILKSA